MVVDRRVRFSLAKMSGRCLKAPRHLFDWEHRKYSKKSHVESDISESIAK